MTRAQQAQQANRDPKGRHREKHATGASTGIDLSAYAPAPVEYTSDDWGDIDRLYGEPEPDVRKSVDGLPRFYSDREPAVRQTASPRRSPERDPLPPFGYPNGRMH